MDSDRLLALVTVVCVTILAALGEVDADLVVAGLLGAGSVAGGRAIAARDRG